MPYLVFAAVRVRVGLPLPCDVVQQRWTLLDCHVTLAAVAQLPPVRCLCCARWHLACARGALY